MKITVLGAGAIGQLFLHRLNQRHSVQCWTRQFATEQIFNFMDLEKRRHSIRVPNRQKVWLQESHILLVCVKAFQVLEALSPLASIISSKTRIVICHNGMGTQQAISDLLPNNALYYAMTTEAALKQNNVVHHTGRGITYIGATSTLQAPLEAGFLKALNAEYKINIDDFLWQKLAINAVINPLTAQYNVKNGDLLDTQYQSTIQALCEELAAVMAAENHPIKAEMLCTQIQDVMLKTAQNYSSMHQDKTHHRQTEMSYITGYLCRCADNHGLSVPTHQHLLTLSQDWEIA
jgi:2-dehydropantoate 2-reductase